MTRPALDRIHEDLMTMPAADALAKVAVWLEDCDDHIALGRPGGLPAPPFKLSQAWVLVRGAMQIRRDLDAPQSTEGGR